MQKRMAAAYIRVSTEEQAELSPESQIEEIRRYAERENIELLDEYIYIDSGISGKKAGNRPEFMRMISVAKSAGCPFSVILLWKYSRFARNQEESVFYKSILRSRCSIDVISVTEPLIDGPFGSLIERIIEWMDEFYSIRLSQEVKRSMKVNAERGKLQCPAAYGYKAINGELIPNELEAEFVRLIFSRFNSGKGTYNIARELNAAGARTHRGNQFESRTVEYILRNPVYIGRLRWNPYGHTGRDFSKPGLIISESGHEPIISIADFDAAQVRLNSKDSSGPHSLSQKGELKSWASGLIRCASCGARLVFSKPDYFRCSNYIRGRCSSSQHIRADLLEGALLSLLMSDSSGSAPLLFDLVERKEHMGEEQSLLEASLRAAASRRRRLRDIYLEGEIEIEEFSRLNRQFDTEIKQTLAKMNALRSQKREPDWQNYLQKLALSTQLSFEPDLYDMKTLNQAVQAVIEECVFDKKDMTLVIMYRLDL